MEANTCSICKHSYNISTKRPLVLPCSHLFCQGCLQKGEATGDQECPVCRKTWGDVRVADLPSRYQVIPLEGQAVKDEIQKADSEEESHEDTCDEHSDKYIFWCESCDVPSCRKCFTLKHKGCEFVLIEDKHKSRKQQEADLSLLKEKAEKYSRDLTVSNEKLPSLKSMAARSHSIVQEMVDYQTNVNAWQREVRNILNPQPRRRLYMMPSETSPSKRTQPQQINWSILEALERKIGNPPSSILVHVAATYQSTNEDASTFISVLKDCVEANLECDKPVNVKAGDLSLEEAVEALTEGGDWVISDATSAAAVQRVVQTTSIRAKKMIVDWRNMPTKMLSELQTFIYPGKSYQVEAIEIMKCFPYSAVHCADTRSSTTARLDAWIRPAGWAALTQFWGHLDAAAVKKLPVTIKIVGLVLREEKDMEAVNALCGTAFGREFEYEARDRLKWRGWTDLSLSVAKTFRTDQWKMKWECDIEQKDLEKRYHVPKSMTLSLSEALPPFGIRLRLYLPHMLPGDRHWMEDLFGAMKLENFKIPVPLFLDGARIGLDPLLGVFRDSGQRWDVHLPASLPQLVQREDVALRYKKYGHSVTWDLE